jgi:hypothetical protein
VKKIAASVASALLIVMATGVATASASEGSAATQPASQTVAQARDVQAGTIGWG